MVTILIVLRCCHDKLFFMNVSRNGEVKKLAYLAGHGLYLAQTWYKAIIFQNDVKVKYLCIAYGKCV